MATSVKLSDILEAMEYPEDWDSFLDRNTGTVIAITDNERPYVEDGEEEDIDDLPAWQRESVLEVRRALEEADLVRLPSKFDIHEWGIMRQFADSLGDSERAEVLGAIHGAGAFRMFRRTIERLGLRDAWLTYRNDAFKSIALDWLTENRISFTEA